MSEIAVVTVVIGRAFAEFFIDAGFGIAVVALRRCYAVPLHRPHLCGQSIERMPPRSDNWPRCNAANFVYPDGIRPNPYVSMNARSQTSHAGIVGTVLCDLCIPMTKS